MTSELKDMWDAIPAEIGIPKDVMDKARVALAYAMTQASDGDADLAVAIIAKAMISEREKPSDIKPLKWDAIYKGFEIWWKAENPLGGLPYEATSIAMRDQKNAEHEQWVSAALTRGDA